MLKCIKRKKRKKQIKYIRSLLKRKVSLISDIKETEKQLIKTYGSDMFRIEIRLTLLKKEKLELMTEIGNNINKYK